LFFLTANCAADLCACRAGRERLCKRVIMSNFVRREASVHHEAMTDDDCQTGWVTFQ